MPLVRTLYAAVVAAYVGALAWVMTQLPARIASHFGADGRADGWSTRSGYLAFGVGVGLLVIVGLPLLSHLLLRGSGAGINVPHKDYWLDPQHPQRREEFVRRFTDDMLVIAGATGLLLAWMHVETVWANRQDPPQLGSAMWGPLAVYLVAIFGYVAVIATTRYRPPRARR